MLVFEESSSAVKTLFEIFSKNHSLILPLFLHLSLYGSVSQSLSFSWAVSSGIKNKQSKTHANIIPFLNSLNPSHGISMQMYSAYLVVSCLSGILFLSQKIIAKSSTRSVFIELVFIMMSIWRHSFYYLFAFLFAVLLILVITSAEISIVITYLQLCK